MNQAPIRPLQDISEKRNRVVCAEGTKQQRWVTSYLARLRLRFCRAGLPFCTIILLLCFVCLDITRANHNVIRRTTYFSGANCEADMLPVSSA